MAELGGCPTMSSKIDSSNLITANVIFSELISHKLLLNLNLKLTNKFMDD